VKGLSLIQRSPTGCVFLNACDFETSKKGRPMSIIGYFKIMHPVVLDILIKKIKRTKGKVEL